MISNFFYGIFQGVLILFLATGSFAATKIHFPHETRIESRLPRFPTFSKFHLKEELSLTSRENLKLLNKTIDKKDHAHLRYNQLFNGTPIWGHHIIVTEDSSGNVVALHGTKIANIETDIDIASLSPFHFTPQDTLRRMKEQHIAESGVADWLWFFKNEVSQEIVFVDDSNRARLCYEVSFFADMEQGGSPSRPVFIIDARTGETLKRFEALTYADGTGPGGNNKTGIYHYGRDFPAFSVTESGSQCIMDTDKLTTWNMNNSNSPPTSHAYECYENTFKEINGGFCPLNDAHFFGGIIHDMYNDWFNTKPLTFKIVLGVHYSSNFDNAFWNGTEAIFGDGYSYFYPLVGLNVISHEIAHGFTEQNSNLIYYGESGAINEAFSDMAGEAAEYYLKGSNDFMVGYDIWKGPGSFRYMDDPTKDGSSIDNVHDYYSGMEVHRSCGIFNKAFYRLSTSTGWDTKMAFEVFFIANLYYWEPSTDFVQAADGAYDAAIHLGYSGQDVIDAFKAVGIIIGTLPMPEADFGYVTNFLDVEFRDNSRCSGCDISSWHWDFGDGSESVLQHPTHSYSNGGTYTVTLTVVDNYGQTDGESKLLSVSEPSVNYCESASWIRGYRWIAKVTVGAFSNSSAASRYSDFTSRVIEVQKGIPYTLGLSSGPRVSRYPKYWRVWADLNHDGDFEGEGEKLFEGSEDSSGSADLTGTIVVPLSAVDGGTRLRVSMKTYNYPNPCGYFFFGEVEDYMLDIE